MNASETALRKLGLATVELVDSAVNNRGLIQQSEYDVFWDQVNDAKEAAHFLLRLIGVLQNKIEKPESVKLSYETLVNTINFVVLLLPFDKDNSKLTRLVMSWKHDDEMQALTASHVEVKRFVRLLTIMTVPGAAATLGPMLIRMCTLLAPDQARLMADIPSYPTLPESDIRTDEGCFLFEHLRAQARSRSNRPIMIAAAVQKLRALAQLRNANKLLAETSLTALYQLLSVLISIEPVLDRKLLHTAVGVITPFQTWTSGYGALSRAMLRTLSDEAVSPGTCMRARLQREARVPAIAAFDAADGQQARPLYYFVDSSDTHTESYAATMAMTALSETRAASEWTPGLAATTKAQTILNMLSVHGVPLEGMCFVLLYCFYCYCACLSVKCRPA
jgi:hypothetical protein